MTFRGYGDQRYAGMGKSLYGLGEWDDGLHPRDILLYYPDGNGALDFNALITFVPGAGFNPSVGKVKDITPLGALFFSDVKIDPYKIYESYHKLWIYNTNPTYSFKAASIGIDADSDPLGWISIAPVSVGAPFPVGNYVNTGGGHGPGTFGTSPIPLGDLFPKAGVAIWIKRQITVDNKDTIYAAHRFTIEGTATADDTPA
jgi:hypothetical protein